MHDDTAKAQLQEIMRYKSSADILSMMSEIAFEKGWKDMGIVLDGFSAQIIREFGE